MVNSYQRYLNVGMTTGQGRCIIVFLGMMKDKKWAGCTLLASKRHLPELLRNEEG